MASLDVKTCQGELTPVTQWILFAREPQLHGFRDKMTHSFDVTA